MEENIRSLQVAVSKEEMKQIIVGGNSGEEKRQSLLRLAASAVAVLPGGAKVKTEPPERDSAQVQRARESAALRVVTGAPEAPAPTTAAAAAEDVKIKQQRHLVQQQQQQAASDPDDRCKVPDSTLVPNNCTLQNSVQKEELENIELNSLGESSLVKLKRRIRLKLLAEEARNSIAKKAEITALEDEILPFPSTRIATRNATSQLSANLQQSFVKDEKPAIVPLSSGKARSRVVDLSSESEDEEKDRTTAEAKIFDKNHPGARSAYNHDALQRLLGPLLSAMDPKDSPLTDLPSTMAAAAGGPRRPGRPAKKSSASSELPVGRKIPESVSSLVKMLKKGFCEDDVQMKLNRQANNKSTNFKVDRKESAAAEDSALEYEQERADNIRRNKEFLAQLGLSSGSTLHHGVTSKKGNRGRTPAASKSHHVPAAATEVYEKHHNIEEILLRNREILERRAAAAAALALGSKRPRLCDSDLDDEVDDEEEDIVPEVGNGGKRQRKNSRSSKRAAKEQNDQHSSGRKAKYTTMSSKVSSSSGDRGKSSKELVDSTTPRAGRRRSIPPSVINGLTASNQELLRFVHELISSASSSLPQILLRAAGGNQDTAAADDSDQSSSPRNNDQDSSQYEDDSPRIGGDSGRKRKDTWLTMITFETPKTPYELERDEILRRHKHQFERLGIVSDLIEESQPPRAIRPYCRRWASEPDPAYQRNTRFQNRQRKSSMQPDPAALKDNVALTGTRSLLEVRSVSCASSLVAKFTGGCKLDISHGTLAKLEVTEQEVMSFRPIEGTSLDPDLTRIYTMDIAPISGSSHNKGLLAAGGSQGRLAVFAISDDDPGSSSAADAPPTAVSETPLLSWTVDSSWVSQVVFLSDQFQENGTLLLSSSNDGRVVLWDINKQRVRSGTRGLSPLTREGIPVVVCETSTLHTGGIFGMHESRGKIASSSEGSVAISTIKETGIVVERSITGHHTGVIRSVRFREQNILADCGVDTVIGILDLRASDPCTLRIQTTHKTGISMIEWSPVCVDSNLLLSASNDPQIYLHDIRYPAKAMLQFEGHVHPRRVKCYSIYRPTFVAGGDAVVTPGEGTHQLSLYSITKGTVMKKLHVGFDPNILLWNSVIPKQGGVWAGCRGITKFQALWQQRGGD